LSQLQPMGHSTDNFPPRMYGNRYYLHRHRVQITNHDSLRDQNSTRNTVKRKNQYIPPCSDIFKQKLKLVDINRLQKCLFSSQVTARTV